MTIGMHTEFLVPVPFILHCIVFYCLLFVYAWDSEKHNFESFSCNLITGKGIPNQLAKDGCLKKVPEGLLPHVAEAADLYQKEVGNSLTRVSCFGTDPLQLDEKISVERPFAETYPDLTYLYNSVVNRDFKPFQDALGHLINLTNSHI